MLSLRVLLGISIVGCHKVDMTLSDPVICLSLLGGGVLKKENPSLLGLMFLLLEEMPFLAPYSKQLFNEVEMNTWVLVSEAIVYSSNSLLILIVRRSDLLCVGNHLRSF